jgi:hypothetical protein
MVPMVRNQIIGGHGHVGEGRMQRGMPEQLLEAECVPSRPQVGNGKGMAELVRSNVNFRLNADSLAELIKAGLGQRQALLGKEELRSPGLAFPNLLALHRFGGVGRKRDVALFPPLAVELGNAAAPVDGISS